MEGYGYGYSDLGGYNAIIDIINFIGTYIMSMLVLSVLLCVGLWFTYKKLGKKGYEGLIPGHSTVIMLEAGGNPMWWFFLLLIPLVNIYFLIKANMDFAESFGKPKWFGIGLALIPQIFYLILGFDKSKFINTTAIVTQAPQEPIPSQVSIPTSNQFVKPEPEPIKEEPKEEKPAYDPSNPPIINTVTPNVDYTPSPDNNSQNQNNDDSQTFDINN